MSRIGRAEDETEDQIDEWVTVFERSVPHPEASDLIFWPLRHGLGTDPSAEEIVNAALSYKPIEL